MAFDTDVYFKGAPTPRSPAEYAQMEAKTSSIQADTQKQLMEIANQRRAQAEDDQISAIARKNTGPSGIDMPGFLKEVYQVNPRKAQAIQHQAMQDDALMAKAKMESIEAYKKMNEAEREQHTAVAQKLTQMLPAIESDPNPPAAWDKAAQEMNAPEYVGKYSPQTVKAVSAYARVWKDVVAEGAAKAAYDREMQKFSGFHDAVGPEGPGIYQTNPAGDVRKVPGLRPTPRATAIMMAQGNSNVDPTQPLPDVGMEAIAQAIARKEQPPQAYSVRNPAGKIINARAAILGQGEIMGAGAQATRQAGLKDFEPQGTSGRTISAINTMTEHLTTGKRLAEALKSGDTPAINRLSQSLGIQMGNSKATNFNTLKQFLSGEVAKVATGGHITEGEIHAAANQLNASGSPDQLIGSLDVMREVAGGKLIALDQDYKRLSGKGLVEGNRLTPATVKAFESVASHGKSASKWQAKPPSGNPDTATIGKNPRFKNAVWVGSGAPDGGGWYVKEAGQIRRVE